MSGKKLASQCRGRCGRRWWSKASERLEKTGSLLQGRSARASAGNGLDATDLATGVDGDAMHDGDDEEALHFSEPLPLTYLTEKKRGRRRRRRRREGGTLGGKGVAAL